MKKNVKNFAVIAAGLFDLTMRKGPLVGLAEGFARRYAHLPNYQDWNEKTVEYHYVRFVLQPESIANPLDGNAEALLGDLIMGDSMNKFCAIEFKARVSDINSEYDKYVRTMGGNESSARPKETVDRKERTRPFSSWFAQENAEAVASKGSACHFLVFGSTGEAPFEAHDFQLHFQNYAEHGQRGQLTELSDLSFCDVEVLVQYLVKLAEARLRLAPSGDRHDALIDQVHLRYAMKLGALICSDQGQYASADNFLEMFKKLTLRPAIDWKKSALIDMKKKYFDIHRKPVPKKTIESWETAVDRVYAAAMYLDDMEKRVVKMAEVEKVGES